MISGVKARLAGSATIAVCLSVQSVSMYAFTILGAWLLGPHEFGALAALLGLLTVLTVLSLGLQATAARRVAVNPHRARALEDSLQQIAWAIGSVLAVVCLALAPVLTRALDLSSWVQAVLLAVTVVPTTVMGAQSGVLQGERRWTPLGAVYGSSGLSRLALGGAAMLWRPDTVGAMIGIAVAAWVPVVIGALALRRSDSADGDARANWRVLLRETLINCQTLLAFLALSNADVVMAKLLLDGHDAGLYAAGLILAKAVLFLPQFVVVVAFPSLSHSGRRETYLRGLALNLAIGVAVTLGVLALPWLAITFIGGPQYADVSPYLWVFAVLGTILTLASFLVYGAVARQHRGAVLLVWAALAVIVALSSLLAHSIVGLLTIVTITDAVALGGLLWLLIPRPSTQSEVEQRTAQ